MLFKSRKSKRHTNRSQQSQRRKSTTRRLQLLEKLEDRRLMAVAGGFDEQLLQFELNRGEYSRSLRSQVIQDRQSGRFQLRRAARTFCAQPIDNDPADIQRPSDGDQKPADDDVKPEKENEQPVAKEDSTPVKETPTTPPTADPSVGGDSFWDARSKTKVEESPQAKNETSPLENAKIAPQAVEMPSVDPEMSFDVEGFLAPDKSGVEADGEEKEKADDTGDADKPVDQKPIFLTEPEELEGSHDLEYRDEGATCKDQVDQPRNRERTDRGRRMSRDGYRIRYDCDDVSGNQAQRRKRPVVIQDHSRPRIQIIQPGKGFEEAGFPYTDRGAEAKDSLDGEFLPDRGHGNSLLGPGGVVDQNGRKANAPNQDDGVEQESSNFEDSTLDESDVSKSSQPPSIFEGVEWNLDRRLRTGSDAGRSRQRTDPKDELENGNQKNENPVDDVPAKPDEEQPPVAGNPNNGAAEQTLEELQEKREELQRQHQDNERQQRELDQQGELGAAEDAELRRLLDEMHNLRDQLEELDKKIGGVTSQSAVNGQEDPAGENSGDAEQSQKLNFSPEEKEAFRRQLGLSEDQMDELLEKGSLQDKGRIFSVFEHADGPPLILVTETDPEPAVDNPNDKEEKAGTAEDQKSDQEGNADKPDDSQEPKESEADQKQGSLEGGDKFAAVDPAATDAVFARAGSSSSAARFERRPSHFQPTERGTDVTGPLSAVMTGTNAAATREAERLAGRTLPRGNRAARIARKEAAAMRGIADVTTKADKALNAANAVVNAVDEVRTSEAQSLEAKAFHGVAAGTGAYLIGTSGPLVAVDVATNGEVTRTTNEAAENAALALDAVTGKATPQQVRERRDANRFGRNGVASQIGENAYDNMDRYRDRNRRGRWRTRNADDTMPNGAINWGMHHFGEMVYDRWAKLFGDD